MQLVIRYTKVEAVHGILQENRVTVEGMLAISDVTSCAATSSNSLGSSSSHSNMMRRSKCNGRCKIRLKVVLTII